MEEEAGSERPPRRNPCKKVLEDCVLLIVILFAIGVGVGVGLGIRRGNPTETGLMWIGLAGEMYVRLVKMLIVPLVVASVVTGIGSLDWKTNGKMVAISILYFVSTSVLAVVLAIIAAETVHPGHKLDDDFEWEVLIPQASYSDVLADLLRNMVPENLIQATFQSVHTKATDINFTIPEFNVTSNVTHFTPTIKRSLYYADGMNLLGLVVFAFALGLSINATGPSARPLLDLFKSFTSVLYKLINVVTWLAPFGVVSICAQTAAKVEDFTAILFSMGWFVMTVAIGLIVHQICLLLVFLAWARQNPLSHYVRLLEAVFAGAVPASSYVAYPFLGKITEQKLGVDPRVARFVLPLGLSINKDGSAFFLCVSIMYIAQTYGIELNVAHYLVMCILSCVLSFGIPSLPSASLIVIAQIAWAVKVPAVERLGLLLATEWLLDRIRTGTNILSTGFAPAIVERLCCKDDFKWTDVPEIPIPVSQTQQQNNSTSKPKHHRQHRNSSGADSGLKVARGDPEKRKTRTSQMSLTQAEKNV